MKVYDAQYLYDYESYSVGLYSSLDKAIEKLLNVDSEDVILFVEERCLDRNSFYDKRVWSRDEGIETFYA